MSLTWAELGEALKGKNHPLANAFIKHTMPFIGKMDPPDYLIAKNDHITAIFLYNDKPNHKLIVNEHDCSMVPCPELIEWYEKYLESIGEDQIVDF
jgi:hypothetical protein